MRNLKYHIMDADGNTLIFCGFMCEGLAEYLDYKILNKEINYNVIRIWVDINKEG